MLIHVRDVLSAAELQQTRELLSDAPWADGGVTAGVQSAQVKNNQQLPQAHPVTQALQQLVMKRTALSTWLPNALAVPP